MIKTIQVYTRELATFYTQLGYEIVSEEAGDLGDMLYHLQANIKDDHQEAFFINQKKVEQILVRMYKVTQPTAFSWVKNILLSILTLVIFLLVGNKYQFFNNGTFTWPFLGELIAWTTLLFFVLHGLLYLFKMLYRKAQLNRIVELGKINKTYIE